MVDCPNQRGVFPPCSKTSLPHGGSTRTTWLFSASSEPHRKQLYVQVEVLHSYHLLPARAPAGRKRGREKRLSCAPNNVFPSRTFPARI